MYIVSQNLDYFKSISQPLLKKSPKDKPKQDTVLIRTISKHDSDGFRTSWSGMVMVMNME